VSTHGGGFAVKQDDRVIAQRGNGHAVLAEFEIELEHALAGLRSNIGDVVPSRYIQLNNDEEDDETGHKLIKGVIVGDACARIEDAFTDFAWPLQHALQRLRGALQ
jgi:hypothetical protein